MEALDDFVKTYSNLYFSTGDDELDRKKKEQFELDISWDPLKREAEEYFQDPEDPSRFREITEKDVPFAAAWKAGKLIVNSENHIEIDTLKRGKLLNQYGNEVDMENITRFYEFLSDEKKKGSLDESLEVMRKTFDFDNVFHALEKVFRNIIFNTEIPVPENIGMVNIINLLFFLTRGEFPIYDKYTLKAVKAWKYGAAPDHIAVVTNVNRNDHRRIAGVYTEYLMYLQDVFGRCQITREEDRALWVYGHSHRNWRKK